MGPINVEKILKARREILQQNSDSSAKLEDWRLEEIFGSRPLVASPLWNLIATESTMQPLNTKESI